MSHCLGKDDVLSNHSEGNPIPLDYFAINQYSLMLSVDSWFQ